ncbi:uncharacterized protein LOC134187320 [Corticium candelabrum]|uniref:uncharacterized protein LOC134187320 n=1 Tax=Corticium candelabrum TaxID=121492 RepID=UPI002E26BAD3|nr:uncharacterized protein LOC134187320 [Corticium candelabrum]
MMFTLAVCILLITRLQSVDCGPIVLRDYGIYPVENYDTVLTFYFNFYNTGPVHNSALVEFTRCCLVITKDDVDCDIMQLADRHTIQLRPYSPETVVFRFHSYYVHDRVGHCEFNYDLEDGRNKQKVRVDFSTSPWPAERIAVEGLEGDNRRQRRSASVAKNAVMKCDGVDEDPQWYCQPADCVLKYKGKRNYYNNLTKKCEPVVKCNTRSPEGTLIAYYDPETNECNSLEMPNENGTVAIRTEMLPDQSANNGTEMNSTSFRQFSTKEFLHHTQRQEESKDENSNVDNEDLQLECNHGTRVGNECKCHDGWMTTEPEWSYVRHWCSEPVSLTNDMWVAGYYMRSTGDAAAVITLSLVAATLLGSWIFLLVQCIKQRAKLQDSQHSLLSNQDID